MKSLKIAYRTLNRTRRRAALTTLLITIGVLFVLLFAAFSGSFKSYMIGQITDSMLGHLQIHKKGYVASLDNMPLDKNLPPQAVEKISALLDELPVVESYTFRLKHSALISDFENSTNLRLNGINPENEHITLPLLKDRINGNPHIKRGEVLIPDIVAKGMKLKVGDTVVLVATNRAGSMNAVTFKVGGIIGIISGPGGRDGYIHIDDSRKLLRIKKLEVNEVVIRLSDISKLPKVQKKLKDELLSGEKKGLEIHDWQKLSPFSNIAKMIDLMSLSIQIILVSIVLISILNVMIMSVYERIKEIGTLSAIGTPSSFIILTFLFEGLLLGIAGLIIGIVVSYGIITLTGDITIAFGRQDEIILSPMLPFAKVIMISVLVMIVAAIASLYPAIKAARMNPVDALRS
ncbi:MAG: FtsX-like permease family protein [Campylobacterota bacterium]|nr:FtsX-like permease family protein [Campylobacterota bacterium]